MRITSRCLAMRIPCQGQSSMAKEQAHNLCLCWSTLKWTLPASHVQWPTAKGIFAIRVSPRPQQQRSPSHTTSLGHIVQGWIYLRIIASQALRPCTVLKQQLRHAITVILRGHASLRRHVQWPATKTCFVEVRCTSLEEKRQCSWMVPSYRLEYVVVSVAKAMTPKQGQGQERLRVLQQRCFNVIPKPSLEQAWSRRRTRSTALLCLRSLQ
mmetsp:Transcript_55368/g.103897  ORF Transcript_55368/g.103897 Transcript_55368/m.103897 type:complete len:211 (-) Transcript_55368:193-825(-)